MLEFPIEFLWFSGTVGGVSGLILFFIYLGAAIDSEDALFFRRTKSVRRMVRNKGFANTDEFVCSLFDTAFEDWKREKNSLVHTPFPDNQHIRFVLKPTWNGSKDVQLSFQYKKRELLSFVHYPEQDGEVKQPYRHQEMDELHMPTFGFKAKRLFAHLTPFLIIHQEADKAEEKRLLRQKQREEEQEEAEHAKESAIKGELLASKLKSGSLWRKKQADGFHISVTSYQSKHFVTFYLLDKPFVNALIENGTCTLECVNTFDNRYPIFERNLPLIEGSCLEQFADSPPETKREKTERIVSPAVQHYERAIEDILHELAKEKDYLSAEDFHHISHTYPSNLHALMEPFYRLKNPRDMEEQIIDSLQRMHIGLLTLLGKAEETKKQHIERQNRLIRLQSE